MAYAPFFLLNVASFFLSYRRMSFLPSPPVPHPVIQRQKISRVDPFTQLYMRLKVNSRLPKRHLPTILCRRKKAPMPPCTSSKRRVCVFAAGKYKIVECPSTSWKSRSDLKCTCKSGSKQKSSRKGATSQGSSCLVLPTGSLN